MKCNSFLRVSILLYFLAISSGYTMCQTISGLIIDKNSNPIAYSTIELLSSKDSTFIKGTISDNNGKFSITASPNIGIIKVSFVGYNTVYHNYNSSDRVEKIIKMFESATQLEEITVRGNLPQYRMTKSGIQTNVAGTMLSKAGTADDVLKYVPSLRKTENGYDVFGKGSPLIYINGKKVTDLSELDRLSSDNISNIELISDPGTEYDATISSVIKIKTIRKVGDGFGFNYRQVYAQAHKASFQEQLDANYRKSGFDIFGTLYLDQTHNRQEQRGIQAVNNEIPVELKSNTLIESSSNYLKGSIGFNYEIDNNNSIGVSYSGSVPTYSRGGWNSTMDILKGNAISERIDNTFTSKGKKSPTHDLNAYYTGMINKIRFDWNGDMYLRKGGNTQVSEEFEMISNDERTIETMYDYDSRLYATKLSLTIPIWKGNLIVGGEYTDISRQSNYQISQISDELPSSTDDEVKENNIAGFASYGFTKDKLQVNGGIRFEHVESNYYDSGDFSETQSKKYQNLFPHFSISLPIKATNLMFSYTAKAQRPSYSMLSGNVQYNDRYTYQGGNPLLQPTTVHTLAATLSYKWIQVYANWRYYRNAFYQCVEPYEQGSDITIFTFRNIPKYQSMYAGLSLSPKVGRWRPMLDIWIKKQKFEVESEGVNLKYNTPIAFFVFNNAIQIHDDFIVNIDMDFNTRGYSTAIKWEPNGGVNIGIYKGFFNNRLSINLQGKDIFASNRGSNWMTYGKREIYKWNYSDTRKVMITVRYKFNTTNSKYKGTGAGKEEKTRL